MPSKTAQVLPEHRHRRSHSRNASISSIASLPTPQTTTTTYEPTTQSHLPPKRNSHHRRRSSVSTRRESAEIMGVSVSESAISPAEDPADKRRDALWALEGKRVEIPDELPAPFEFPTKPSFPPGSGSFTAKRDSFKPSLSSKDALHTLVEEEEEEDDADKRAPPTPTTPTTVFMRNITARPRPPHLRPLSLTPDSLPVNGLPTPASAKRSSLKVLALAPDALSGMMPSPSPLSSNSSRARPVFNLKLEENGTQSFDEAARPKPVRKSSISYKVSTCNAAGLPTPETTPTCSERRFSTLSNHSISSRSSMGSEESLASRPLSASEQHFLFKSHNALLARITDLERALSFRNSGLERASRPSSVASALSHTSRSSSPDSRREEPIDEMVSLVSDLKSERDELRRDVEGWRTRVADLEKQLTVFTNRVEVERREAWVARTQRVADLDAENELLAQGQNDLRQQVVRLLEEKQNMVVELQEAKTTIVVRDTDPLSTPRAFDGPVVTIRPVASAMKRGLGFTSLDSQSSTDVDEAALPSYGVPFKLRAVEEDDGEDDGLAGYEDEDENDVVLSPSSSFGSVEEFYVPRPSDLAVQPIPSHAAKSSISTWTFPTHVASKGSEEPEVDRFFGCLDDLDDDIPSPNSPNYAEYDEEKSKGLFAKGFGCNDAKSCFVLPASVLASADASFVLDSVVEEDDEETEGETVVEEAEINNNSGIKITFTPPMDDDSFELPLPVSTTSPSPKIVPPTFAFSEDDQDDDEMVSPKPAFNFCRSPQLPATPPTAAIRHESPSSIPRLVSKLPPSPTSPPAIRSVSPINSSPFVTPPTKRGGTMPSFIPQPTSPSRTPPAFSTNASTKASTTFIRQPARQPLLSNRKPAQANANDPPHVLSRYASNAAPRSDTGLKSVQGNIPSEETTSAASSSNTPSSASPSFTSIMSSPLGGRLSFQTLSNYIPSWGMTSPRGAESDALGHDSTRMARAPAGPAKRGFAPKPPGRFAGTPRVPFPSDGIIGSWRNKLLAHPKQVQTRDAGEDFYFYNSMRNKSGVCFGVADGVTGWLESGVDPALFAQALMFHSHRYSRSAWAGEPEINPELDYEEREQVEGWELTPYECLDLAYGGVLREKFVEAGSSTACIISLNAQNGLLQSANLGDSGFSIIRDSSILYHQPVQTHFFNCPKQLTKLPPPSGRRFTRACVDSPREAETYRAQLCDGDVVVAYTDGFSDNVFRHELVEICSRDPDVGDSDDAQAQSMADRLVLHARECMAAKSRVSPFERQAAREGMFFPGGKPDDVTVVVALVRENQTKDNFQVITFACPDSVTFVHVAGLPTLLARLPARDSVFAANMLNLLSPLLLALSSAATHTLGVLHRRSYFYVGQTYVPGGTSSFAANQMYVERLTPAVVSQPFPLLIFHGQGQTGTNFLNTPDGRLGWADYFLGKGYELYIIDQPSRGRSAWQPSVNGPLVPFDTFTVEARFTATQRYNLWPQAYLHTQWPGNGSMGDPIFDAYYASNVGSINNNTEEAVYVRDAGSALLDIIGPAIVVTHSQAGQYGWILGDSRPRLVKGIVALEPLGPPFINAIFAPFTSARSYGVADIPLEYNPQISEPSELAPVILSQIPNVTCFQQPNPARKLANLLDIPVLVVTSESGYHSQYDNCTVNYLRQGGVHVEHVQLGQVGIHGNGHLFFMEKNNIQIVDQVVRPWFQKIQ
ncbi:hypothetical protein MKEN_00054800 [Mycena kentingensis (nom. inval.)]|nr:hypothetical protein MKEN_00054800 [Mycena kentingensis (nom. inval.)]